MSQYKKSLENAADIFSEMDREFFKFRCEHPTLGNSLQYMEWNERVRTLFQLLGEAHEELPEYPSEPTEEVTKPGSIDWVKWQEERRAEAKLDAEEAKADGETDLMDDYGPWTSW